MCGYIDICIVYVYMIKIEVKLPRGNKDMEWRRVSKGALGRMNRREIGSTYNMYLYKQLPKFNCKVWVLL